MRRTALTRQLPLTAAICAVALFAASPAIAGADHARSDGPLVRWSGVVPQDAGAVVKAVYDAKGRTTVMLQVRGLQPNTEYGAHAHVNGCGLAPGDSGGHFQNVVPDDPALVMSPLYANPQNEIWLDLTTNAAGNGVAKATVPWQFSPERRPGSVVLHERHTSDGQVSGGGAAGTAGARLACLDVDF